MKVVSLPSLVLFLSLVAQAKYCIDFYNNNVGSKAQYESLVPLDLMRFVDEEVEKVGGAFNFKSILNQINPFKEKLNQESKYSDVEVLLSLHPEAKNWPRAKVVKALNKITFERIKKYQPIDPSDKRLDGIDAKVAQAVLDSLNDHPVASQSVSDRKYEQTEKGINIGYCFGRAFYVHEMLLRLGVDENSIKKIWAVGEMNSGDISWQFHVATMVRLNDGKWVVIDPILGELVSAEHWYKEFAQENSAGDLRAYITEANKFGGSAGKYDPKQLGLKLDVHRDFYKNFFTHLQGWFKFYSDDKALSKFLDVELPKRANSKESEVEKEKKRQDDEERLKKKIQDYYDNMG